MDLEHPRQIGDKKARDLLESIFDSNGSVSMPDQVAKLNRPDDLSYPPRVKGRRIKDRLRGCFQEKKAPTHKPAGSRMFLRERIECHSKEEIRRGRSQILKGLAQEAIL